MLAAAVLAERADTETQRVSFPSLLLNRDHRSEVTAAAREALFETFDRLALAESMANGDPDGFAHASCDSTVWSA